MTESSMTIEQAWELLSDPDFRANNTTIVYFLGEDFCVATEQGLMIQEQWEIPLTLSQQLYVIYMVLFPIDVPFHAVTQNALTAGNHQNPSFEPWMLLGILDRGEASEYIDWFDPYGGQHPDYEDIIADYRRQRAKGKDDAHAASPTE